MKIEKQVCSLKLAKKLIALGADIKTVWYWTQANPDSGILLMLEDDWQLSKENCRRFAWDGWPAPTVAELGVLLPWVINDSEKEYYLICYSNDNAISRVCYESKPFADDMVYFEAETEADARAEALIWLIDNSYLKAEDLKL